MANRLGISGYDYVEFYVGSGKMNAYWYAKALSSKKDYELYEAIRHLSILKELPHADPQEVEAAEKDVDYKQKNLGTPSEMALISRLHWWTVEFGLIGDLKQPKIYGAGLLSSIGESYNCLTEKVKKLPYNLETQNYAFDITTQQPHLFVTPNFQQLIDVLEEFAKNMAFRIGGLSSLLKAIECENVTTSQLSSDLQISGIFTEAIKNGDNQPAYLKTKSPTALSYKRQQISGHGKEYHQDGFGTPVGSLKDSSTPLERMSDGDLGLLKIEVGKSAELTFESGVSVKGNLDKIERKDGRILLMKFSNCRASRGNQLLFDPAWGEYDMAVREKVVSVFCGAADKDAYEQVPLVPKERTIKIQYDSQTIELQKLYQKIREYQEQGGNDKVLSEVWQELQKKHLQDWLLSLEILEILSQKKLHPDLEEEIRAGLQEKLVKDGLNLIYGPRVRVAKEKR